MSHVFMTTRLQEIPGLSFTIDPASKLATASILPHYHEGDIRFTFITSVGAGEDPNVSEHQDLDEVIKMASLYLCTVEEKDLEAFAICCDFWLRYAPLAAKKQVSGEAFSYMGNTDTQYRKICWASPAGTAKGNEDIVVYQDIRSGKYYYRFENDFQERMNPL